MNWQKLTKIFSLIILASVIIYDVVAIVKGGTESSISHMVIMWAYAFPLFPLCVGIVIGHLFWRMKSTKETLQTIDKRD